jgi:SSS family solute:Na+ symporter
LFRALKTPEGTDTTIKGDYFADEGDPRVRPLSESPFQSPAEL